MSKVLSYNKLASIKHEFLTDLPDWMKRSFGNMPKQFIMCIWGQSGNGKSNFIMKLVSELLVYGTVLYVSLEEGFGASIQQNASKYFTENQKGLSFADYRMTYDELTKKLSKKRSANFIIIDSVQYWDINTQKYKVLRDTFTNKTFIFISHAKGKLPDGKTADKIRYDAGIKVYVEGFVAFVKSRFGGQKPCVIWEEGAKKHFGKQFKKLVA